MIKSDRQFHKSVSDDSASLTRRAVARKRRFSHKKKEKKKKTCAGLAFRWPPSNISSPFVLTASRSRRVERWYTTTPTGSFSGLHQKNPPHSSLARSPRDPCFASLLNLHFFLRFSVRRVQPLETSGRSKASLYARLHFQSNTHGEETAGNPELCCRSCRRGETEDIFSFFFFFISLLFLLRTYGDRHVSSG